MQESADKAVAAVSIVIAAARPVAVVGKELEHKVEQLDRFGDFHFGHWIESSRSGIAYQRITGGHDRDRRSLTSRRPLDQR
jgi:hypothetical protein